MLRQHKENEAKVRALSTLAQVSGLARVAHASAVGKAALEKQLENRLKESGSKINEAMQRLLDEEKEI